MENKEGSERRSHKEEEIEGGSVTEKGGQGTLAKDNGTGVPEFLVTPLPMVPVCLHGPV